MSVPALNNPICTYMLPADVAEMVLLIYSGYCGDPHTVECLIDTAAGLGRPFRNWMGWLMGCVLSPDKSKSCS